MVLVGNFVWRAGVATSLLAVVLGVLVQWGLVVRTARPRATLSAPVEAMGASEAVSVWQCMRAVTDLASL